MSRYYDPTERRNRWRWRAASLLNRLPGMCWADLVSWALGSRPLRETRADSYCTIGPCGRCYCGNREAS